MEAVVIVIIVIVLVFKLREEARDGQALDDELRWRDHLAKEREKARQEGVEEGRKQASEGSGHHDSPEDDGD